MNNYSDFGDYGDGGGYDGGGGFQTSQSGSPPKKGGSREQSVQTVTPVTIKMLLECEQNPQDDSLIIDGKQVGKVVVYGRVVGINSKHTFIDYAIDDGTGIINVSKVVENDSDSSDALIPERSYVNVHGAVINVDQERKITAHFMRVVQDHNELTAHYLSVIFQHYQNLKGPLNDGSKIHAAQQAFGSGFGASGGFGAGNTFNQPLSTGMTSDLGSSIDNDSRLVHDAFASDMQTDTGLSVHEVTKMLSGKGFTLPKVRAICQNLMTEGFIYSTIDDDHFKSTGSVM